MWMLYNQNFCFFSFNQELVNQASVENLRELALGMVSAHPGLIFDLLHPVQRQPDQGFHPSPSSSPPEWCVCSNCRQMPTLEERVCCARQPINCIAKLPVSVRFCSQNHILSLFCKNKNVETKLQLND